jgi:hypothetical protein
VSHSRNESIALQQNGIDCMQTATQDIRARNGNKKKHLKVILQIQSSDCVGVLLAGDSVRRGRAVNNQLSLL